MTRTTADLAARVATSGAAAFAPVVSATKDRLFRAAMRLLGHAADSEDAVQETYVRAFDALLSGRYEERGEIVAWLLTILTRVAIDTRRGRAVREAFTASALADVAAGLPHSVDAQIVASIELAHWLSTLPFEQRVVVVLRHLEGMTSAEVGRALGISEGAVEQRSIRAFARLRKAMSDDAT